MIDGTPPNRAVIDAWISFQTIVPDLYPVRLNFSVNPPSQAMKNARPGNNVHAHQSRSWFRE
jgi:hypothetical protein